METDSFILRYANDSYRTPAARLRSGSRRSDRCGGGIGSVLPSPAAFLTGQVSPFAGAARDTAPAASVLNRAGMNGSSDGTGSASGVSGLTSRRPVPVYPPDWSERFALNLALFIIGSMTLFAAAAWVAVRW